MFFGGLTSVSYSSNPASGFALTGLNNKLRFNWYYYRFWNGYYWQNYGSDQNKYTSLVCTVHYSGISGSEYHYGFSLYPDIQSVGDFSVNQGGSNWKVIAAVSGFATDNNANFGEYTLVPYTTGANAALTSFPATVSMIFSGYYTVGGNSHWDNLGNTTFTFVEQSPTITSQPISLNRAIGQSGTFSVAADSFSTLSYQWQKNQSNIGGATSSSITFNPIASGDFTTSGVTHGYRCLITNAVGTTYSDQAQLYQGYGPFIATQPNTQTCLVGATINFSVVATGSGTLTYQWYKDNSAIPDATTSTYSLSPVLIGDAGTYKVLITDYFGTTTSNNAVLTVGTSYRYGDSQYFCNFSIASGTFGVNDSGIPVPIGYDSTFWPSNFFDTIYRGDGKDIIVTDAAGNLLPREIVEFNRNSKKFLMWFKTKAVGTGINNYLVQWGGPTTLVNNDVNTWLDNYSGHLTHRFVSHFNGQGIDSVHGNNVIGWVADDAVGQYLVPITYDTNTKFVQGAHINEWIPSPKMLLRASNTTDLSIGNGTIDFPTTMRSWISRGDSDPTHSNANLPIFSKGHWSYKGEYYFGTFGLQLMFATFDSSDSKDGTAWAMKSRWTNDSLTGYYNEYRSLAATYAGTSGTTHLYVAGTEWASTDNSTTVSTGVYNATNHYEDIVISGSASNGTEILAFNGLEIGRVAAYNAGDLDISYANDTVFDELFMISGVMSSGQMHSQYLLENGINGTGVIYFASTSGIAWDGIPWTPPIDEVPPTIVNNPINQTANLGNSVTFVGSATSPFTMSYQWYFGSTPIEGAYNSTYIIPSVTPQSYGSYHFTVSNLYGISTSNSATLTVTSNSGIVNPTGIDPGNTGIIPTGIVPSGIVIPSGYVFASGYIFIDKTYQGLTASEAVSINHLGIGNLFAGDNKTDSFLFGNLKGEGSYFLYAGGINSGILPNIYFALNQDAWTRSVEFSLPENGIQLVNIKYEVEDDPGIGYGTMQVLVAEKS